MRLENCNPKDNFDTGAVGNAAALGFPAINPIPPELLERIQDANWPVAQDLFQLLAQAGPEIAPHLNAIFDGDDEGWKYFILVAMVRKLKPDVAELLRPSVIRMAHDPTNRERAEDVGEMAREVADFSSW